MRANPPVELLKKCETFSSTWRAYCAKPRFDRFVEFAVMLSSFAEYLGSKGLSGLHQLARDLEQQALDLFGDETSHPIGATALAEIDHRVESLCARVAGFLDTATRTNDERRASTDAAWIDDAPRRSVWLIAENVDAWRDMIAQLGYFGVDVLGHDWRDIPIKGDEPCCVVVDIAGVPSGEWDDRLRILRARFAASNLIGLAIPDNFGSFRMALGAGCDHCFTPGTALPAIVSKVLELSERDSEPAYRVLIVEDSMTAAKMIRRALNESGVDSLVIGEPSEVLGALARYAPDLVLMDMHMPGSTGVETARVIRQHAQFLSVPIVFLSGETDIALQVEALRLGGDHFLTKPFNPVILNAVVQSKIERYRALRRSMFHDSLTGLLNHTSTKQRLDAAVLASTNTDAPISVAMLDIDHFKRVNDSYGHPVGDQVIRSLAWLLKRRLRASDIVGRYGGEEFLVALPAVGRQAAFDALDRIRRDFGQIRHPFDGTWFSTTFSGGIACVASPIQGEALVKAADEALYQAKREGRNRIVACRGTP